MVRRCWFALFLWLILFAAKCESLLCRKLKRNLKDLDLIDLNPSIAEATVECPDGEGCATLWFQFHRQVFPIHQGCWRDFVGLQHKSMTKCTASNCTVIENAVTHGPFFCPFGPLEVCCCNQSLCNSRVTPYHRKCIPNYLRESNSRPALDQTDTNTVSRSMSSVLLVAILPVLHILIFFLT